MAKGVDDAAETPAIVFADGMDRSRPGRYGPREDGIGVGHR
jgi:hypothetical protein